MWWSATFGGYIWWLTTSCKISGYQPCFAGYMVWSAMFWWLVMVISHTLTVISGNQPFLRMHVMISYFQGFYVVISNFYVVISHFLRVNTLCMTCKLIKVCGSDYPFWNFIGCFKILKDSMKKTFQWTKHCE